MRNEPPPFYRRLGGSKQLISMLWQKENYLLFRKPDQSSPFI